MYTSNLKVNSDWEHQKRLHVSISLLSSRRQVNMLPLINSEVNILGQRVRQAVPRTVRHGEDGRCRTDGQCVIHRVLENSGRCACAFRRTIALELWHFRCLHFFIRESNFILKPYRLDLLRTDSKTIVRYLRNFYLWFYFLLHRCHASIASLQMSRAIHHSEVGSGAFTET